MCILTLNVVQNIINKQATHDIIFTNKDVLELVNILTLLFDMCFETRTKKKKIFI
jgi:hypothetical protein